LTDHALSVAFTRPDWIRISPAPIDKLSRRQRFTYTVGLPHRIIASIFLTWQEEHWTTRQALTAFGLPTLAFFIRMVLFIISAALGAALIERFLFVHSRITTSTPSIRVFLLIVFILAIPFNLLPAFWTWSTFFRSSSLRARTKAIASLPIVALYLVVALSYAVTGFPATLKAQDITPESWNLIVAATATLLFSLPSPAILFFSILDALVLLTKVFLLGWSTVTQFVVDVMGPVRWRQVRLLTFARIPANPPITRPWSLSGLRISQLEPIRQWSQANLSSTQVRLVFLQIGIASIVAFTAIVLSNDEYRTPLLAALHWFVDIPANFSTSAMSVTLAALVASLIRSWIAASMWLLVRLVLTIVIMLFFLPLIMYLLYGIDLIKNAIAQSLIVEAAIVASHKSALRKAKRPTRGSSASR
jgi:hypothetical protein